jgi:hypothetical protein
LASYDFEVVDTIARLAQQLDAPASALLLESLRPHWGTYPRRRFEVGSWHGPVRALAGRLAPDPTARAAWLERHPGLLVAEPISRGDVRAGNRRRQALDWARGQGKPALVQEAFKALGYPTLEAACEQAGGYVRLREPTPAERHRIGLLLDLVERHLEALLPGELIPPIRVIDNPTAAWSGMASCHLLKRPHRTRSGLRVRFRLDQVGLEAGKLAAAHPARALATLLHELAHLFGSEASQGFSGALTELLEGLATCAGPLAELEKRWRKRAPGGA